LKVDFGNHFVFHGWEDEALCLDMDSRYFILPDTEHLSPSERSDLLLRVRPYLEEGVQVCASCPIQEECLESSSAGDRAWTVRGGIWPKNAGPRPKLPPPRGLQRRPAGADTPEAVSRAFQAWLQGFEMTSGDTHPEVDPRLYDGHPWRDAMREFRQQRETDCIVTERSKKHGSRDVAGIALALSEDRQVLSVYRPGRDGRWRRGFFPKDRFVLKEGVEERLPVLLKWRKVK